MFSIALGLWVKNVDNLWHSALEITKPMFTQTRVLEANYKRKTTERMLRISTLHDNLISPKRNVQEEEVPFQIVRAAERPERYLSGAYTVFSRL